MPAARARIEKSDAAYRSIGEAAGELGIEAHVIRYWETRFPRDVKPVKRPDGRRLFRPEDLAALRAIQTLVHQNGLTLKGAKLILAEQGVAAVLAGTANLASMPPATSPARALQSQLEGAFTAPTRTGLTPERRARLQGLMSELTGLKARLDRARAA